MNASQNVPTIGFSNNDTCADQATDVRLQRLQQNASHMERLQLRKSDESNNSWSVMASCPEDAKKIQRTHERVTIDQTHHAATGEILGVIAHKWRQPLNAISLIVQNVADAWKHGELNDAIMERFEHRILEQINLLNSTIDDSRSYFAADTATEVFDPAESVRTVVNQLSGWFSRYITIDVRVANESGGTVRAVGCKNAFERVIVNLLCNANDAIEERQCGNSHTSSGIITVDITCSDEDIVIRVEDTGGGIDASNAAQIFKPYFTTKSKADGFGMGLYLSRLIVENSMNGGLWFENIPGGAQFNIRLPALRGERA